MNSPMTWIGVALIVLGLFWAAQGFDWIGGSAMSGQVTWAVIGPLVALAGVGVVVRTVRSRS